MNVRLPFLRDKTAKLTTAPGVYLMKNKTGLIIYVGKAKNLHNRVSSYFRENASHTPKVASMVEHVYDFDFIVTDSEYEALVLECSLIKQNQPKYNILLKDDKGYHYICISNETYPRVSAEKNKEKAGTYFGLYMSGFITKETVKEVNTIFCLPTCHKKFSVESGKSRPCLNYYIKQCMGVCRGNISAEQYGETIEQVKNYIHSGSTESIKRIQKEMEQAAESLNFEQAAILRDRIQAIRKAGETQKILDADFKDADVIAMANHNGTQCISVLIYRNRRLFDKETFFFSESDLTDFMDSFLSQYYHNRVDIPSNILINSPLQNQALLEQLLSQNSKTRVKILIPQRGTPHKLIQLSKSNASEELALKFGRVGKDIRALEELGKILGLQQPPSYIEAYDISNLSSSAMVAGMIVFENGIPLKNAYKRFSIKESQSQDDYRCMQEVISRRLQHLKDADEEGFARKPDLILLDGGIGHVHAVQPLIEQFGYQIPVFGMVKDNKHRTRAIASNGGEITITNYHEAFMLLTRIQDEVHRYSVNFMKSRHKKESYSLKLTAIKGIGTKKAEKILLYYKTKEQLKSATIQDLMKIAGINQETAKKLHELIASL